MSPPSYWSTKESSLRKWNWRHSWESKRISRCGCSQIRQKSKSKKQRRRASSFNSRTQVEPRPSEQWWRVFSRSQWRWAWRYQVMYEILRSLYVLVKNEWYEVGYNDIKSCGSKKIESATLILLLFRYLLFLQFKSLRRSLQLLLFLDDLGHQLIKGDLGGVECLGAGLSIDNPDLIGHFGSLFLFDCAIVLQIEFVPHQKQVDFGDICLFIDFLDPEVYHFERSVIGDIEHKEYSIDVSIVVRCDGVISGGARCVPDLHSHCTLIFKLENFLLVLDANRGGVVQTELLIDVLG